MEYYVYDNSQLQLFECERKTIWTLKAEEMNWYFLVQNNTRNNSRRINIIFIALANSIDLIQKWQEVLKVNLLRKVLGCSRNAFLE